MHVKDPLRFALQSPGFTMPAQMPKDPYEVKNNLMRLTSS